MKIFNTKQEVREDIERRTDPSRPLMQQADEIMQSMITAGCLGVRSGLDLLKRYASDEHDFPCDEHREIAHRLLAGMKERFVAFELELINVMVDMAWELNNCECDYCAKMVAQEEIADRVRKAPFN